MSLLKALSALFLVYTTIAIAQNTFENTETPQHKIQAHVNKGTTSVNNKGPGGKLPIKGHILFYHVVGTVSHIHVVKALIEELLNHGHSVTSAFYHPTKIIHENYTEVLIENQ